MMANRPNLVFVFPDEFRLHALGCLGQDPTLTPNLDRFAAEGLLLTQCVSNYPVCSPYRAMLLTGKYPHANGVLGNCNSETAQYGAFLSETEVCLSDVLHAAGYSCGYIGKWHLDPPSEQVEFTEGPRKNGVVWDSYTPPGPRRHGFDFWYSYGCCDWHFQPHYWTGDAPIEARIDVRAWSARHETDVAIAYLRNEGGAYRDPDQPCALIVSHNPPHMPFDQVPAEYVARYGDRTSADLLNRPNVDYDGAGGEVARKHGKNYFAAVTGVDEQFGRLLRAIEDEGLRENTIVVFTSDHGEMMGSHGLYGKNVWYDESLLVPFIIRWPDHIAPGHDDLLLGTPDLLPTFLALLGLGGRLPAGVQGRDLSAALLGRDGERPTSALYLYLHPDWPAGGRRGLRTQRYTFVIEREREQPEQIRLYDNLADPYQCRDIAADQPALVDELTREITDWLAQTGDPWLTAAGPRA
ncbi:MAG: sulfatase family protein [Thermomicrobiales bacterium]